MIKFVALIEEPDLERKLSVLLDAAKVAGVPMELGVVPLPVKPSRRKYQRKGRSTKKAKGKHGPRRSSKMMVKMSRRAPDGPPKLIEVHTKLRSLYGSAAFRKGEAKGALKTAGLGHSTGYVTRLMETGSIVPA